MNKLEKILGSLALVGSLTLGGCKSDYRYTNEETGGSKPPMAPVALARLGASREQPALGFGERSQPAIIESPETKRDNICIEQILGIPIVKDMKVGTYERRWPFGKLTFREKMSFDKDELIYAYIKFNKRGDIDNYLENFETKEVYPTKVIIIKSETPEAFSIFDACQLRKLGRHWRINWLFDKQKVNWVPEFITPPKR